MEAHTRRNDPRERGMVLLAVLFFTIVLGGVSWTFLQEGLQERADVDYAEHRLRAREVAEYALMLAEKELAAGVDAGGDGIGTVTGLGLGGSYQVECTAVAGGNDEYLMVSTGWYGHARRILEAGVRRPAGGLFPNAMFGKDSVKLTGGSHTDSYDSEKGTWASQVVGTDADGLPYAGTNGTVGSNGEIVLSGPVRKDAIPGVGFTVDHGEEAWGSTTPRTEDYLVADPSFAEFAAAFASNDNLSIDVSNPKVSYDPAEYILLSGGGAPITLEAGTYIFNTLKMTGGGNLIINGPVKIYITNYFEISGGGIANVSGVPSDCLIYAHPYDFPAGSRHDKMYVKTSGGSETAIGIYAPACHVEVSGGGTFYGALVGTTVVFSGGSAFHYDEALGRLGGSGGSGVERVYLIERGLVQ